MKFRFKISYASFIFAKVNIMTTTSERSFPFQLPINLVQYESHKAQLTIAELHLQKKKL